MFRLILTWDGVRRRDRSQQLLAARKIIFSDKMPANKKFCGNAAKLPEGYSGRASRFECLKRGYGACLASGAAGSKCPEPRRSPRRRERVYCGNDLMLPEGYDRYGDLYECLKKGYGACLYYGKKQPPAAKKRSPRRRSPSPSRRLRSGKSPARRRGSPRSNTRSLGS